MFIKDTKISDEVMKVEDSNKDDLFLTLIISSRSSKGCFLSIPFHPINLSSSSVSNLAKKALTESYTAVFILVTSNPGSPQTFTDGKNFCSLKL